jgi:predicted acyl esterase
LKSCAQPFLAPPDEIRKYIIDMAATGNLFLKNHPLRLDITSSNFPRFDRNLNTGNPLGLDKARALKKVRPGLLPGFTGDIPAAIKTGEDVKNLKKGIKK